MNVVTDFASANAWEILRFGVGVHALLVALEYFHLRSYSLEKWSVAGEELIRLRASSSRNPVGFHLAGNVVFVLVNIVRIPCGLLILLSGDRTVTSICLALVALCLGIEFFRLSTFLEGSDHMAAIAAVCSAIVEFQGQSSSAANWMMVLLVGQVCLSYFVSGVMKLISRPWQTGEALQLIVSSYQFGRPYSTILTLPRRSFQTMSWIIMGWEASFPIALLHPQIMAGYLVYGIGFHLTIAAVMGLNRFPVAFIPTYGVMILSSRMIHDSLFSISW